MRGTVRGSSVAPIFYIIYKSDLKVLCACNKLSKYADDINLLVPEHTLPTVNFIFFTDEKLFTVAAATQLTERSFLRPFGYQKEGRRRKPTASNQTDLSQSSWCRQAY